MRIFLLFSLFLGIIYWKLSPETEKKSSIDVLQIRQGAPQRSVRRKLYKEFHQSNDMKKSTRILKSQEPLSEIARDESQDLDENFEDISDQPRQVAGEMDEEEVVESGLEKTEDFEENLFSHISDLLHNLDPNYGEEIFENFKKERDFYQSQLEDLARNDDGSVDMESVIEQLEVQHEEKMQEILGPYYQVVREQYSNFIENNAR